jgi:hypothetical protein
MAGEPPTPTTPPPTEPPPPAPPAPPSSSLVRWKKVALWGAGLLTAFTLIGFFGLPPLLKSILTKKLTELLHRETTIQAIRLNPFAMTLQINGFMIKERRSPEPFVAFEELFVNLEGMSLIRLGPVVSEIRLTAPHVSITRHDDLTYNFSDLLEAFSAKPAQPPPPPKQDAEPLRFSLNNIQLLGGRIDFHDRPKHADHTIRDLTLIIPFLSNLPASVKIFTTPEFRAIVNGTPVGLKGQTKPFDDSLATEMRLDIEKFDIPTYLEYVPGKLTFKLPSASLDTRLTVAFTQFKEKSPTLTVAGAVALSNVVITTLEDQPVFSLPLLDVQTELVDVFGKSAHLKSILIKNPDLRVKRERDGVINLTKLGLEPPSEATPAPPPTETPTPESKTAKTPETPFRVLVDEITLDSALVVFTDATTEPSFKATIQPLTATVSHFSNEPGKPTAVDVSLTSDAGESITHQGEVTVEPLSARGAVSVQHVPLRRYTPYYDKPLRFTIEDGRLDLSTQYVYEKAGPETRLTDVIVGLKDLRLRRKGEKIDFLTLPEFTIKKTDVDVEKQRIVVGEIATRQAQLLVERARDGTVNLTQLVATPAAAPERPKPIPAPATSEAEKPARPWTVELAKLALDRYSIKIHDHVPADSVTLTVAPIGLTVANFSTAKNNKAAVTLKLGMNKTGTIAANGSFGLDPLIATIKLDAKGLDLVPLQPYVAEKVNLVVTSGAASAQGTLSLSTPKLNEPVLGYTGDIALAKFAVIDKANSEDLVRFSNFAVNGIRLATSPFALDIKAVTLADLAAHLTMNTDKTLNVSRLVVVPPPGEGDGAKPAEEKPATLPAEGTAEPKVIHIDTLSLTNGAVHFADRSVKPNFSTKLGDLQATVTNLSSDAGKPADVDVKAKLDDASPLAVAGKLNPLSHDLFVDLKVDFRDMELSPLTPYSGKFAGYTIQKGKLSLDLAYLIDQRKLDSTNKVFIDQFTFGDKVDSPDATGLPVRLAVSLLQDRKGRIKLDLPVAGSLDDPKFSVWGVVLDIVVNLLTKAATAPFALLGSLLPGGGEELSAVEFAAGAAVLDAAGEKRLTSLGSVLADRPALKVEIAGRVDPEKDREGLRKALFDRKLKAQKLKELVKRGESATSVDEVTVAPEEYGTYLTKVYKEEDLPNKPTNFLGIAKSLPQKEMEQLLLDSLAPTDDDLRRLATQRAQAVRDYLLNAGRLDPQRVFLLDSAAAQDKTGEKKAPATLSRVDLAIK